MSAAALALPDRLIHLEEVNSTNSEARRLAETGERGSIWILADRQMAGRGRRGRAWQMVEDNLAATLLLTEPPPGFAQLSFATALAVADTVLHFASDARITVKWPNDVLADGKKVAGILLESGAGWLAIGVGINLAHFPEGTEFPATALSAFAAPPPPVAALAVLAARFDHWRDAWTKQGFEALRSAWLARADGLGAPIRARLPHETRHGVFQGIDSSGALLLDEQGRISAIAAGEVFF